MTDPYLIKIEKYKDDRGWFSEVFKSSTFNENFNRQNESFSLARVFRGLHSQAQPQTKLIRCLSGVAIDFVYDPFADKLFSFVLDNAMKQVYCPKHCMHGYFAVTPVHIQYFVDAPYNPRCQIVLDY